MKKVQLVIPMAGLGSRFAHAGYAIPKPLIPIHGVPMFQVVLANLLNRLVSKVIIVCPKSFQLPNVVSKFNQEIQQMIEVIEIDYLTSGPATTVALARNHLDLSQPLVTANSDQFLQADLESFYLQVTSPGMTGVILTMEDSDPKWSYVALSEDGHVTNVREKVVISNHATAGVYGFSKASDFFDGLQVCMDKNETVNGEYYVAPVYNEILKNSLARVTTVSMGPVGKSMFGIGIPVDYEAFIDSPVSLSASKAALALNSSNLTN